MDRNTLTGLVLIFVIIAGSFYLLQPSDEEIKRERQLQDSLARARAGIENVTPTTTDTAGTALATSVPEIDSTLMTGPFGQAIAGDARTITLENKTHKTSNSTKNAPKKKGEKK